MANLKYLGSTYTEDKENLLYVCFNLQGQEVKWFPKWSEVIDIMRSAYVTEECCNDGKMSKELLTCLLDLVV